MSKRVFIVGLLFLAFAIFSGVLASSDYHDPIGVSLLMFITFVAGFVIGTGIFIGEDDDSECQQCSKDGREDESVDSL